MRFYDYEIAERNLDHSSFYIFGIEYLAVSLHVVELF